jgi:predicted permease
MEIWRRLWYLLNRSRFERELQDEIAAHREMKGAAGPRFGNVRRIREEADDEWGWGWLDRIVQDFRFATRLLRKSRSFTATAVAVLALGVGVNLSAFQVFDTVALSWLPVRSPETVVTVVRRSPRGTSTALSYPAFEFYRNRVSGLSAAHALINGDVMLGDDRVRQVPVDFVSAGYFEDLGAVPLRGRLLVDGDDHPDAQPVVVLSEKLWKGRFGADESMIGRTILVNDAPFVVAGVAPTAFVGVAGRGVAWIPVTRHPLAFPGSTVLGSRAESPVRFVGRLRDGVTAEAAEAELKTLVDAYRLQDPRNVWDDEWLDIRSAGRLAQLEDIDAIGAALVTTLIGLVLVTACMNLGLLLLARSVAREREFAIRFSVGASRRRILRQLLTENLVLAALGTLAGGVVSMVVTRAMLVATGVPAGMVPYVSPRIALVAAALALVSSLLFGFTPAIQALKPAPTRLRFRNTLLAVQVGAACVLLIVSALLTRGVLRVTRVPLGFEYQTTLMIDPKLSSYGVRAEAADAYWKQLESRVRNLPGVADAALASLPPFGGVVNVNSAGTMFHDVTPSYFTTMKIPLKRGRVFSDGEKGVVLVSEALARRQWPGADPLGQTYSEATVIGVTGDARTVRIGDGSSTECYRPIGGKQLGDAVMVVRVVDGSQATAASALRRESAAADTRIVPAVVTLSEQFEARLETPRQVALLTAGLGLCALLLAVTGLAGLVSFTVSQRIREIGVRLALGAAGSHILRAMGRQFVRPIAVGLVGGVLLSIAAAMVLSRELFGLSPVDPIAYGGAAVLFAAVAGVAMLPSLRRALRVDPITALRHD